MDCILLAELLLQFDLTVAVVAVVVDVVEQVDNLVLLTAPVLRLVPDGVAGDDDACDAAADDGVVVRSRRLPHEQ